MACAGSLNFFCDLAGVSFESVVNFSNDGVASDVEKKGCDLLTNGFVLGVWNECVHNKTGKMRAIGKLKDIVCDFFECDLSVWAFGRRMDKLSDLHSVES